MGQRLSRGIASGIVPKAMQPRLFLPTPRQTNWLLLVALLSLGEAIYLRYLAIEYAQVSLACQAGLSTWLCASFRLAIVLYNHSVFGWVALAVAATQPGAAIDRVGLGSAADHRVRPGTAQRKSCRPGGRVVDPQSRASCARTRVSASANRAAENHNACQLAKLSLPTM